MVNLIMIQITHYNKKIALSTNDDMKIVSTWRKMELDVYFTLYTNRTISLSHNICKKAIQNVVKL